MAYEAITALKHVRFRGPAQSAGIIPADGDFPLDLLGICCTPVHDSYAANACVHSAGIRQGISFFFSSCVTALGLSAVARR